MRPKSARVHDHAAFVVRRPAAIEPPVLLDRVERIRVPEISTAGRLDVVVRVEEDGGCAGRSRDVTDDRGNAFDLDDLRFAPGIATALRGRSGRTAELSGMVTLAACLRDA